MWITLWILISAFIIGVALWSMQILQQQKRAWSSFAKKHGYEYQTGKFMESPTMKKNIEGMLITLYTDVQRINDIRGERYVTVIEIILGQGMPTGAVLATPEWKAFVESLTFDQSYTPENIEGWREDYIIKTRDSAALKDYLTDTRLQTLQKLFAMKNSMTLFFFDEKEAVLRIETADPLRDSAHIEKIIKRIIDASKILRTPQTQDADLPADDTEPPQGHSEPAAPEA